MTLAMTFLRTFVDIVKLRLKDLDCAEAGTSGWTLLVLAIVAAKIKIADLLR